MNLLSPNDIHLGFLLAYTLTCCLTVFELHLFPVEIAFRVRMTAVLYASSDEVACCFDIKNQLQQIQLPLKSWNHKSGQHP